MDLTVPTSSSPSSSLPDSDPGLAPEPQPSAPRRRPWHRSVLQLIRRGHLYVGLLMLPWVVLYAVTTFLFNHPGAFSDLSRRPLSRADIQATPLEALPASAEVARQAVAAINTRTRGQYLLVQPEKTHFERAGVVANVRVSDGKQYVVFLEHGGNGGFVQPRPERKDMTTDPAAPFAARGGVELERPLGEQFKQGLPPLLDRVGFTDVSVTDVQLTPVSFLMEGDGKLWRVSYNPQTGAVSGKPADAAPTVTELTTRQFLLRLHLAHGYPAERNARWVWAVLVDVLAGIMVFWGISGLLMWWQIKATRWFGLAVLVVSVVAAVWVGLGMHEADDSMRSSGPQPGTDHGEERGSLPKQVHRFQEALTRLALVRNGIPEKHVHWGAKLGGKEAGIDTDLLIAEDIEQPTHVLQIRHSGSSKEQEKKFWREIHELAAVEAPFAAAPIVVSVIFDDAVKEGLYKVESLTFDAILRLPDKPYGRVLVDWCRKLTQEQLPQVSGSVARRKRKAYLLLDRMTTTGNDHAPELARALEVFRSDLRALLTCSRAETVSLWTGVRHFLTRSLPEHSWSSETTSIKRGLAKLLLFEESDRPAVVEAVCQETLLPDAPDHAETLGLTQTMSHGAQSLARISDWDLIHAIRGLGRPAVELILQQAPLERMEVQYLQPIRELAVSGAVLDAIVQHGARLSSATEMRRMLAECADDPGAAAHSLGATTATRRNWLIDSVMALARTHSRKRQGYGYRSLARDCGVPEFARLPGLTISQYCSRRKAIPRQHLARLAQGLSKRLKIILPALSGPQAGVALEHANHLLETRLIPYRQFDPIGTLVGHALEKMAGVSFHAVPRQATTLSEYAEVRAATTKVLLASRQGSSPVAIAWQSPNRNPRDKQKEFCGRIAMLRHTWAATSRTFVRRPFRACLFVADGAWTPGQKKELARFGFNAVLSPLELGRLEEYLA